MNQPQGTVLLFDPDWRPSARGLSCSASHCKHLALYERLMLNPARQLAWRAFCAQHTADRVWLADRMWLPLPLESCNWRDELLEIASR